MQDASHDNKLFRVAVIGSIANPNMGDEAILEEILNLIGRMYGNDCIVYVFSKKAFYTACNTLSPLVIPTDCLHRVTRTCYYKPPRMRIEHDRILSYKPESWTDPVAEELHAILSSIDMLHIVGGGYLNGFWTDMTEEVYLLTRLAQRYRVRTIATGIGVFPIEGSHLDTLRKALDTCELVDFRDKSISVLREAYQSCEGTTPQLQQTIDDAVDFGRNAPAAWDAHVPGFVRKMTPGRYLNISLHVDVTAAANETPQLMLAWDHALKLLLLPWSRSLIERGLVNRVNLLSFSPYEERIYQSLVGTEDYPAAQYHIINPHALHPYAAQQLISHACYNVGTRYHQAVFSLAAGVPSLGISISPYYRSKLESIHGPYGSKNIIDLSELTSEVLTLFEEHAAAEHQRLVLQASTVRKTFRRKLRALSEVYASSQVTSDELYERMVSPVHITNVTKTPLVSVICPLRNAHKNVRMLLDNLLGQSLTDIEVICIDDGSTDNMSDALVERSWFDRRIRLLTQRHLGCAQAANTGIRAARGEYVFFLCQHDRLASRSSLALLYQAARARDVSLACGSPYPLSATTTPFAPPVGEEVSTLPFGTIAPERFPSYDCWNATLYRRELLLSNNLLVGGDSLLAGERFFVAALVAAGKAYVAEVPVLEHRQDDPGTAALLSQEQTASLLDDAASLLNTAAAQSLPMLRDHVMHTVTDDFAPLIAPQIHRARIAPELKGAMAIFEATCARNGVYCEEGAVLRSILGNARGALLDEQRREADAQQQELAKAHATEVDRLRAELDAVRTQFATQLSQCEQEFTSSRTWKIGRLVTWLPRQLRDRMHGRIG